jgi:hypothetical protein
VSRKSFRESWASLKTSLKKFFCKHPTIDFEINSVKLLDLLTEEVPILGFEDWLKKQAEKLAAEGKINDYRDKVICTRCGAWAYYP